MAKKLTKRERTAAARRAAIMATREFQEWWAARRHIHPVPSDPFRAFMIDRGIQARPVEKEIWKPRTNRVDVVPIDVYHGARHGRRLPPRGKKRRYKPHTFRMGYVPAAARPIGELTPQEREMQKLVEEMAKHYNVSVPDIVFERKEGEGTSAMYHGDLFGSVKPFMKIGVRGQKVALPKLKAVVAHEMGHHVHRRGAESVLGTLGIKGYSETFIKDKERIAWKIADPFMKDQRAVQKWVKKFYLGTYLGTSPRKSEW